MRSEPEDKQIRKLFARMRQQDGETAPPFVDTWSAALERERAQAGAVWTWSRLRGPLPLGAAAAAVIAAMLFVWTGTDSVTSLDSPDGEPTITAWTAPSTSFLGLDGGEFLDLSEAAFSTDMSIEAFNWDTPTDGLFEAAMGDLGEERDL